MNFLEYRTAPHGTKQLAAKGKDVKLLAGLGNPGPKYANNRHNVGFMALDAIADSHAFSPWRQKFQGQLSEGRFGSDKVLLLKPETFMNLSGQSVSEAMRFYKLGPDDVIVFHDEIDLAPGKCRAKSGGGHAGHNGLRSIHQHIGPDYHRIRIGVGHPGQKEQVPGYVLHDFSRSDEQWLQALLDGIADGANWLAKGDTGRFMNAVSVRMQGDRLPNARRPISEKPAKLHKPTEKQKDDPKDMRSLLQRLTDRFS